MQSPDLSRELFSALCVLINEKAALRERLRSVDDAEIIKKVQAGDSESFSILVDKYHRHLLNFIYRLVRDRQIVEDIGQEVFLSVYKSIRAFDMGRGVPFSAWLFITARNRCISELRRKRAIRSLGEIGDLPAQSKTPEQVAADRERMAAIWEALEQLQEPFKCTILQSLNGTPLEVIAWENGISLGTVKSRLFRAREKMKLVLYGRFGGGRDGQL